MGLVNCRLRFRVPTCWQRSLDRSHPKIAARCTHHPTRKQRSGNIHPVNRPPITHMSAAGTRGGFPRPLVSSFEDRCEAGVVRCSWRIAAAMVCCGSERKTVRRSLGLLAISACQPRRAITTRMPGRLARWTCLRPSSHLRRCAVGGTTRRPPGCRSRGGSNAGPDTPRRSPRRTRALIV